MSARVDGSYRHYKGGVYTVLMHARDAEDCSEVVVYSGSSGVWVRKLSEWNETVTLDDGKEVLRFTEIV